MDTASRVMACSGLPLARNRRWRSSFMLVVLLSEIDAGVFPCRREQDRPLRVDHYALRLYRTLHFTMSSLSAVSTDRIESTRAA